MNTTAKALIFAIVTVASAASIGMGTADSRAQAGAGIVKLERVVIVGKRAEAQVVAQLPRVVIEGRRMSLAGDVQVADAGTASQAF